ncbi:MAG: hypothetical protein N3A58_01255 [Spirochaetes bacterium]|nr:hypothetical protein [Spirochaetota bacterium]
MKDKIKISIIIQARINSKRFKAKVLKNFGPYNIIEFIQKRFLLLENDNLYKNNLNEHFKFNFILAIPYDESRYFYPYLQKGFNIVEGEHFNVLQRFYDAFSQFEGDYLIRATGDNPYFSLLSILDSLEIIYNSEKLNKYGRIDYIVKNGLPLGTGVEFISKEAFYKAYNCSDKEYQFEHVTPYIYENPHLFNIFYKDLNQFYNIKNLRLTFDEKEDFEVINFIGEKTNFSLFTDLIEIEDIFNENPEIFKINHNIKQKSFKDTEIERINNG